MNDPKFQKLKRQVSGLVNAIKALEKAGEPWATAEPLRELLYEIIDDVVEEAETPRRGGRKRVRLSQRIALSAFAAAVTVLKETGSRIDDAVAEIAIPNRVARKKITDFRNRLSRGLASDRAYKIYLAEFNAISKRKMMAILARMAKEICT